MYGNLLLVTGKQSRGRAGLLFCGKTSLAKQKRRRLIGRMAKREYTNIGEKECRKRRAVGVVSLGVTVVLSFAFVFTQIDWYWYLILFVPSLGAMEGALQVREKT